MEIASLAKMAFALGAVLGLIALAAVLARRFGLGDAAGLRREDRRLKILETMPLDARRRVLLIACDNQEHLVLLGQNSEAILPPKAMDFGEALLMAQRLSAAPATPPLAEPATKPKPAAPPPAFSDAGAKRRREPSLGPLPMPKTPE